MRLFENGPFHLPKGLGRAGLLILVLLAVVAAASACGGGNSDKQAEEVMGKFIQIGQNAGATAQVMIGKLPADLPQGLPEYPGTSLVGSTVTTDGGQKGYSVLRETDDPLDNIVLFYEDALEQAPWQVVLSTSEESLAAMQFAKQDDQNFGGTVIIQSSPDNKHRSILVSVEILGAAPSPPPFELGASKPLPRGFPAEMPLYPEMTVIDSAWGKSAGSSQFQVIFLTKSLPQDVIAFYSKDFRSRGWTTTDTPAQGTAIGFTFEHQAGSDTWSGSISADTFTKDATYTQATLQLRIGPESTPTPLPSSPSP